MKSGSTEEPGRVGTLLIAEECPRTASLVVSFEVHLQRFGETGVREYQAGSLEGYTYRSRGPAVIVVCPTSMRYPSGSRM
jgi:hypothetical protein